MKTSFLFILIFVVGCGGSDTIPPGFSPDQIKTFCETGDDCSTKEECVSGACVSDQHVMECYADQDCEKKSKCIENICVYRPECLETENCDDPRMECILGRCVDYIELDACTEKECSDSCAECGPYTLCNEKNICEDACVYRERIELIAMKMACADFTGCVFCDCWSIGLKYDGGIHGCGDPFTMGCNFNNTYADDLRKIKDWEGVLSDNIQEHAESMCDL